MLQVMLYLAFLGNIRVVKGCELIGWGDKRNNTLEFLSISLPSHSNIPKETTMHYPCILNVKNFHCQYYQITWEKYPTLQMFPPTITNNELVAKFYYWGPTFQLLFGVKTKFLQIFYSYNLTCASYIFS